MRLIELAFILIVVFVSYGYAPVLPLWGFFNLPLSSASKTISDLRLKNAGLKAELLELQLKRAASAADATDNNDQYRSAKIYSSYPFNDRSIFTIAAGARNGVRKNAPVLAARGLLLGKVIKVFDRFSEVESIFSPAWKLPVKIGAAGIDGLLIGGPDPRVTMIVAEGEIVSGNAVYSASRDFPYGLKIGDVAAIKPSANNFFKEISLDLGYRFGNLLEVLVAR